MSEEFFFGKGFDAEGFGMAFLDRIGGNKQAIEDQEARGQQKLCRTQHFPKRMQAPREVYEASGKWIVTIMVYGNERIVQEPETLMRAIEYIRNYLPCNDHRQESTPQEEMEK